MSGIFSLRSFARWALDTASCGGGATSACASLRAVDAAGEEAAVALACDPEGGPCGLTCDGPRACEHAWLGCPDGRRAYRSGPGGGQPPPRRAVCPR